MKNGDILLFGDGEMAEVMELDYPTKGMVRILGMEDDELKFYRSDSVEDMSENLGQAPTMRALFHVARSVHVRLNKLGKI